MRGAEVFIKWVECMQRQGCLWLPAWLVCAATLKVWVYCLALHIVNKVHMALAWPKIVLQST